MSCSLAVILGTWIGLLVPEIFDRKERVCDDRKAKAVLRDVFIKWLQRARCLSQ